MVLSSSCVASRAVLEDFRRSPLRPDRFNSAINRGFVGLSALPQIPALRANQRPLWPLFSAASVVRCRRRGRAFSAICGRLAVGKGFLIFFRTAGRSCHLCGLFLRHVRWPLAIMLSADRVPVKSTRSRGAMARNGLSRPLGRLAWVRYSINALSNLVARSPARSLPAYAATGCDAR